MNNPRLGDQSSDRGGMASLKQVLGKVCADSELRGGLKRARVVKAWKAALGPALARRTQVVSLRKDEMVVEVESAAHFHELNNFTGERYRQMANHNLGNSGIRSVLFQLKRS